jgi:hypothetical protein
MDLTCPPTFIGVPGTGSYVLPFKTVSVSPVATKIREPS